MKTTPCPWQNRSIFNLHSSANQLNEKNHLHVGLPEKEVEVAYEWKSAEENHPHDHSEVFNSVSHDASEQSPIAQEAVEAANDEFEEELTFRKAKCIEFKASQ